MKRIFKHLFMLCLFGIISIGASAADIPNNEIWYEASAKLTETTSQYKNGFHTNVFNTEIKSHTFSNGRGIITFNANVTSIGGYAFSGCSSLTSVTIPNSVTGIGASAFAGCSSLTSVTIPNSVTAIGQDAFLFCYNVKELIYAEGTKTVLAIGLTSITSVTIPNSVTSIGKSAFSGCSGLTSVTIPSSVTDIGENAFYGCSGLTSVTIPNSVIKIGKTAFCGCSGLTSVTIPKSVIEIGYSPFLGCSGLTSISVESGNTVYDSRDNCNAIIETVSNELISGCKNTIIPNSVIYIGRAAFAKCSGLASVTIPNNVTLIGIEAFANCSGLASVKIPNTVTLIGDNAFYQCLGLTGVTIPNSVKQIGYGAFFGCYFQSGKFVNNSSLNTEYNNYWGATICDTRTNEGLCIKNKSVIKYCGNGSSVTIPNTVTSIGEKIFWNSSNLTSVTIGKSVTSIENQAFQNCSKLASVTFKSLPALSFSVFDSCDNLSSIVLDLNDSDKPYIGTSLANYPNNGNFTEVHYNRTLAADTWGTMVLPFVPDESSLAKVKLYALSDASSDAVRFKEVEADAVQAGVPYLFKNVSGQDDFTLTTSNTTISTNLVKQTPVNGMMLQGVYQQQKFTGDDTVYGISGNKFLTTTGTMTVNPFHAYLKSVASGAKEILIDDEIDDIEDIKNLTPALSQGEGVNLQGIHVGKGYNGIVIINGKKYLNK